MTANKRRGDPEPTTLSLADDDLVGRYFFSLDFFERDYKERRDAKITAAQQLLNEIHSQLDRELVEQAKLQGARTPTTLTLKRIDEVAAFQLLRIARKWKLDLEQISFIARLLTEARDEDIKAIAQLLLQVNRRIDRQKRTSTDFPLLNKFYEDDAPDWKFARTSLSSLDALLSLSKNPHNLMLDVHEYVAGTENGISNFANEVRSIAIWHRREIEFYNAEQVKKAGLLVEQNVLSRVFAFLFRDGINTLDKNFLLRIMGGAFADDVRALSFFGKIIESKPDSEQRALLRELLTNSLERPFEEAGYPQARRAAFIDKLADALLAKSSAVAPEQQKPVAAADDLPTTAPEIYQGLRGPETPPEFVKRVYSPWLGRLDRAHIRALDPTLSKSINNWLSRPGNEWPVDVDLPTRSEQNRRMIERLRAEAPNGQIGRVMGEFSAREADRIRSAARRRK